MKSFLDSIKARFNTAKATLDKGGELQRLEADVANTKAEYARFSHVHNASAQRSEAHRVWTEAAQALATYRSKIKDAEDVVKDCKPLLSARTDLDSAHREYAKSKELEATALGEISNLEKLIAELEAEVIELNGKAKHALNAHGVMAVAARLIGQPAPQTPKAVLALNADIESRRATLESAEAMLSDAQKRRADANSSAAQARDEWKASRHRVAEIEYRDALAAIAPQISTYLGADFYSYPHEIKFAPGAEALETARELLAAELARAPANAT